MHHPLLGIQHIQDTPAVYLARIGEIFAVFDARTQDSGNISYGVRVDGERFFVKTAGSPSASAFLPHADRVGLLQNAVRLAQCYTHPALPRLLHVIETSPCGPLLVYEWVDGELLGTSSATRNDPLTAFQRFRRLSALELGGALDGIFEVHNALAELGWVAVDFYDGCLIYDFERQRLHLIDLDMYQDQPFTNTMGRMFGSTRFMAPEEFVLGATIDERTNVFTMGRTIAVFLSDGTLEQGAFRGNEAMYEVVCRACREDRGERFDAMTDFYSAWGAARQDQ